MTDAHCHLLGETRHFLASPFTVEPSSTDAVFYGAHPWYLDDFDEARLRSILLANPAAGVGEIGLDRLKEKTISPRMREVFERQLIIAAELKRPIVLHGAKCWGEVVKAVQRLYPHPPAALFHGFSRSDGLIPDIVALNGYISVGPALLNDHAINYRAMVKKLPLNRVLVESDRTSEDTPSVVQIAEKLAELLAMPFAEIERLLEANASRFIGEAK